jgi:hypothetical protein
MSEISQFTSEDYPGDSSEIVTDATGFGYLNALFEGAVTNFGNDESVRWPSYSEDNVEFKVNYAGQGTVVQEGMTCGRYGCSNYLEVTKQKYLRSI